MSWAAGLQPATALFKMMFSLRVAIAPLVHASGEKGQVLRRLPPKVMQVTNSGQSNRVMQLCHSLASFRALRLLSGSLRTPLVSGLQRPVHGPLALLLAATSVVSRRNVQPFLYLLRSSLD
jgi:hypothetical protein